MSSSRRRVFSEAFKRAAVDRVAVSRLSVGEVAAELGLHDSVLRRWMEQFGTEAKATPLRPRLEQNLGGRGLELAGSIETFVALSQVSRWELFLLLLRAGPVGLTRGEINRRLGLRSTAISTHLRVLEQARLIRVAPESRQVGKHWGKGVGTFTINYERLTYLLAIIMAELREYAPGVLSDQTS